MGVFVTIYHMMMFAIVVVVMVAEDGDGEVDADSDEKDGTEAAEPDFDVLDIMVDFDYSEGRIRKQPSDDDDRETCAQTIDDGHEPTPSERFSHGHGDEHSEVHHATIWAKSEGEDEAEEERGEPCAIRHSPFIERNTFLYAVIVVVVVMLLVVPSDEHEESAADKERAEGWFAVGFKKVLNAFDLRPEDKNETQEGVCHDFSEGIHEPTKEDTMAGRDIFTDIADGGDVGTERTGADDGHEPKEKCRENGHCGGM